MSCNTLITVSYFTNTCGRMSTQIAAMTTLHIHLNGNYLSEHHNIPCRLCRCPPSIAKIPQLDLSPPQGPRLSVLHLLVRQSVECQLIRLFSSPVGSSFQALQRSGSLQHCVSNPLMEHRCHNMAMKKNSGAPAQQCKILIKY